MNHIHTTHSWEFLGMDNLEQYHQPLVDSTSDVIIGVIDTGKICSNEFHLQLVFLCADQLTINRLTFQGSGLNPKASMIMG